MVGANPTYALNANMQAQREEIARLAQLMTTTPGAAQTVPAVSRVSPSGRAQSVSVAADGSAMYEEAEVEVDKQTVVPTSGAAQQVYLDLKARQSRMPTLAQRVDAESGVPLSQRVYTHVKDKSKKTPPSATRTTALEVPAGSGAPVGPTNVNGMVTVPAQARDRSSTQVMDPTLQTAGLEAVERRRAAQLGKSRNGSDDATPVASRGVSPASKGVSPTHAAAAVIAGTASTKRSPSGHTISSNSSPADRRASPEKNRDHDRAHTVKRQGSGRSSERYRDDDHRDRRGDRSYDEAEDDDDAVAPPPEEPEDTFEDYDNFSEQEGPARIPAPAYAAGHTRHSSQRPPSRDGYGRDWERGAQSYRQGYESSASRRDRDEHYYTETDSRRGGYPDTRHVPYAPRDARDDPRFYRPAYGAGMPRSASTDDRLHMPLYVPPFAGDYGGYRSAGGAPMAGPRVPKSSTSLDLSSHQRRPVYDNYTGGRPARGGALQLAPQAEDEDFIPPPPDDPPPASPRDPHSGAPLPEPAWGVRPPFIHHSSSDSLTGLAVDATAYDSEDMELYGARAMPRMQGAGPAPYGMYAPQQRPMQMVPMMHPTMGLIHVPAPYGYPPAAYGPAPAMGYGAPAGYPMYPPQAAPMRPAAYANPYGMPMPAVAYGAIPPPPSGGQPSFIHPPSQPPPDPPIPRSKSKDSLASGKSPLVQSRESLVLGGGAAASAGPAGALSRSPSKTDNAAGATRQIGKSPSQELRGPVLPQRSGSATSQRR